MKELLFAYWEGFTATGAAPGAAPALRLTPACVDIVALAFAVPAPGSGINTDFLTSKNSQESIVSDTAVLRARGQKVILSVNGNPAMPWNALEPELFAQNVKALAEVWGLDGIDLDNEEPGEIPGAEFVAVIKAIRAAMGTDFIISYPGFLPYRDAFLAQVKDDLTLVCTMAYWNDFDYAVSLFQTYAEWMGPEKVCLGLKPGRNGNEQSTPVAALAKLAAYEPPGTRKGGVMLYSLSLDIEPVTGLSRFGWTEMIHKNMPSTGTRSETRP